ESWPMRAARALVYLTALAWFIVAPSPLYRFILGKFVLFRGCVGLACSLLLLELVTSAPDRAAALWGRIRASVSSPLALTIGAFVAAFQIASLFGVDASRSFWGDLHRGDGGLQLLCLYLYFVLLTVLLENERQWRRLLKALCVAALA